MLETLRGFGIQPTACSDWHAFAAGDATLGITVAPLENGLWLVDRGLRVIPETLLLGERVRQRRRRRDQRGRPGSGCRPGAIRSRADPVTGYIRPSPAQTARSRWLQ